jgi:hypothetical protein
MQPLKTKSAGFGGLRFLPNTLGDVRALVGIDREPSKMFKKNC